MLRWAPHRRRRGQTMGPSPKRAGFLTTSRTVRSPARRSVNQSESEVTQSCPTLCDPVDCSPPGSSVHGISQARILEWVAISTGDLPDQGIEPRSPTLQADALTSEPPGKKPLSTKHIPKHQLRGQGADTSWAWRISRQNRRLAELLESRGALRSKEASEGRAAELPNLSLISAWIPDRLPS